MSGYSLNNILGNKGFARFNLEETGLITGLII